MRNKSISGHFSPWMISWSGLGKPTVCMCLVKKAMFHKDSPDVTSISTKVTFFHNLYKCVTIYDFSAGSIHQPRTRLHRTQQIQIKEILRGRMQWAVDCDNIALFYLHSSSVIAYTHARNIPFLRAAQMSRQAQLLSLGTIFGSPNTTS